MRRRLAVGLAATIVLGVAAGIFLAGPDPSVPSGGAELTPTQSDQFDRTVFRIEVYANGDARWTVEQSRALETEEEETRFREFAERFRSTEMEAYENFKIRAERLTTSGSETTGREMAGTGFERDAYVDPMGQTSGVVEMSFRWKGFAQVDDERVVVADVFGGGWAIVEDQRLTIRAGQEVVFSEVDPEPDSMTETDDLAASDSVTWFGERQFADERPRVTLVPPERLVDDSTPTPNDDDSTPAANDDSGGDDDPSSTDGDGSDESDGGDGMSGPMLVVGLLFLVGVGSGALWYSVSRSDDEATGDVATTVPETQTPEMDDPPAVAEEELLSDEDRVLHLLEENGGRMKQVSIVEETDWSKSKVSMLLSEMEDDDQISKLRVGRENIISLAGEEPDAAGSPFDDE